VLRATRAPGWKRLWRHSYRLGLKWLVSDASRGWPARRAGFARLLVPLDPWRYYELGKAADEELDGRCLDVSSPKLLPSLLQSEGKGDWLCIDLFESEIEAWRRIDPALELDVQDAIALPYADASFDCCACVSVLEHIGGGLDGVALSEIWRVLKPGGVLVLTTDVAAVPRDIFTTRRLYGRASQLGDERGVFFKHEYSPSEVEQLLSARSWAVEHREYAAQRNPAIERQFYARAPWSYAYGPLLRLVCPANVVTSESPELIERDGGGVVYLRLRKHVDDAT
jgi:SAM-dependent methyltransferase